MMRKALTIIPYFYGTRKSGHGPAAEKRAPERKSTQQ